MRGVLNNSELTKDITETELKSALKELAQPINKTNPDNYVSSPTSFGGSELSEKHIETWRLFRKDNRESANLETILQYVNDFHEKNNQCFTEQSIIDNLHIVLPSKSISHLNNLRRQNVKLGEIYNSLCFFYGSTRTKQEVISLLHEATDKNTSPMETLIDINNILNLSDNSDQIQELGLNEARRYLKKVAGGTLLASLECFFQMSPNKSYREYYRLAKIHFSDELRKPISIKKVQIFR